MATVSSNAGAPADKNPAWERWNPGVLHTAQPQERRAQPPSPEAIQRRAYAAGFEQGKQAGLQAGREAGYAEGQACARAEAAQLHAVAQAAEAALQALGDTLAHKTVALAAAIAQKLMQREIHSCPDSLLDVVREALTLLPDGAERVRVLVNSADAALLRDTLSASSNAPDCAVAGLDDIERGGCRITSSCGDIDATLATRVARVLEALGTPDEAAA